MVDDESCLRHISLNPISDIFNPNPRLGQQHTCALHSAPLTRQYKKRPSTRNAQSTVSSHQSFFQSLLCRSQLTVISHFSNETLPVCDYTQLSVISCQLLVVSRQFFQTKLCRFATIRSSQSNSISFELWIRVTWSEPPSGNSPWSAGTKEIRPLDPSTSAEQQ